MKVELEGGVIGAIGFWVSKLFGLITITQMFDTVVLGFLSSFAGLTAAYIFRKLFLNDKPKTNKQDHEKNNGTNGSTC